MIPSSSPKPRLATALGLLAAALLCGVAAPGSPSEGGAWDRWRSLRFKAKGGGIFSGSVEMNLEDQSGRRQLETRAAAKIFGVRVGQTRTLSVFDAPTGRPEKYVSHSAKRGSRYVFGADGYTVFKLRPPQQRDAPLERWNVISKTEFPYPSSNGSKLPVYDYYGMILQLGRLALNRPGNSVELFVATPDGPERYLVEVCAERQKEVEYTVLATGKKQRSKVRQLRLRIVPVDPKRAGAGFLGMEGETEIWVEAETKTLLEINGKVPNVGAVRIVLVGMG